VILIAKKKAKIKGVYGVLTKDARPTPFRDVCTEISALEACRGKTNAKSSIPEESTHAFIKNLDTFVRSLSTNAFSTASVINVP
jgi:hypothetical protein